MRLPMWSIAVLCLAPLAAQQPTPQPNAALHALVRQEFAAALRGFRALPAPAVRRSPCAAVAAAVPVQAIFADDNLPPEWLEFAERARQFYAR